MLIPASILPYSVQCLDLDLEIEEIKRANGCSEMPPTVLSGLLQRLVTDLTKN